MFRCYIPCDGCPAATAAGVELYPVKTAMLWRATLENVNLCYSYANCGGIDYFETECRDRGGEIIDGQAGGACSCDFYPETCNATTTTNAVTVSIAIAVGIVAILCVAVVAVLLVMRAKRTAERANASKHLPRNDSFARRAKAVGTSLKHSTPTKLTLTNILAGKNEITIVPVAERSFATSNYKLFYETAEAPPFHHQLLLAVHKSTM